MSVEKTNAELGLLNHQTRGKRHLVREAAVVREWAMFPTAEPKLSYQRTPTDAGMRGHAIPNYAVRGFTLLELLVVVAIIGLLAAYVGPKYFSQVGKSEHSLAKSQIDSFARALNTYRLDNGTFPSSEEGLAALTTRPAGAIKWNGPYLERAVPNDPWGRPYLYRPPGQGVDDFDIVSLGKDGRQGGVAENADISYR